MRQLQRTSAAMTETDIRIGRSLGWDRQRTAAEMYLRWKRPLSAERDRRARAGANQQARGQITRTLKNQLREEAN